MHIHFVWPRRAFERRRQPRQHRIGRGDQKIRHRPQVEARQQDRRAEAGRLVRRQQLDRLRPDPQQLERPRHRRARRRRRQHHLQLLEAPPQQRERIQLRHALRQPVAVIAPRPVEADRVAPLAHALHRHLALQPQEVDAAHLLDVRIRLPGADAGQRILDHAAVQHHHAVGAEHVRVGELVGDQRAVPVAPERRVDHVPAMRADPRLRRVGMEDRHAVEIGRVVEREQIGVLARRGQLDHVASDFGFAVDQAQPGHSAIRTVVVRAAIARACPSTQPVPSARRSATRLAARR